MSDFQAHLDFGDAVKEVNCLLELAKEKEASHPAHAALLKSSILLLATKVESFLEGVLEEARFSLEQNNLPASCFPDDLIISVVQSVVDESLVSKARTGNVRVLERLKVLAPFLTSGRAASLPIDVRFSYGKHGEGEVKKIFRRIGLPDIFNVLDQNGDPGVSFGSQMKADLNSITALRNNIIHSDASPSFTVEQVAEFVDRFLRFAGLTTQVLVEHCAAITERVAIIQAED